MNIDRSYIPEDTKEILYEPFPVGLEGVYWIFTQGVLVRNTNCVDSGEPLYMVNAGSCAHTGGGTAHAAPAVGADTKRCPAVKDSRATKGAHEKTTS
jgi:hypothetical protein